MQRSIASGLFLALLVSCGSNSGEYEDSGGTPATGGTGIGGGGVPTTGGSMATGGAGTGGAATGGIATGGTGTGGAATGGTATGGISTGGAPTGGVQTGGAPSGGTQTGGTPTGGVSTGGAPAGGGPTGGVGAGGAETGGTGTGGEGTGGVGVCSYLTDWPADAAPDAVGSKLAQLFSSQNSDGTKHYKEACAWYGSLQVAGLLDDQSLLTTLTNRYTPYKDSYGSLLAGAGSVDENVWGIVPLELYLHNSDSQCLADGVALADHQQANIGSQRRNAVDDMFMMTGLQVQAYRATNEAGYLDFMAPIMVDYLGMQLSDGLFNQLESNSAKWSRGNGWFASGMTEMLRELDEGHGNYQAIRQGYERMMEGLLAYQIQSGDGAGLWKQVIDTDTSCFAETSGSAMFTNAMVTGVKNGWLDCETYGPVARKAWIALVGKLQSNGQLTDISDWMYGGTVSEYCSRQRVTGDNHGQAPMLWIAAALLR